MAKLWMYSGLAGAILGLAAVVLLVTSLPREKQAEQIVSEVVSEASEALQVQPAAATVQESDELRAVWVPAFCLTMTGESGVGEAAFQKKFDGILASAVEHKMNALIVQVRAFSDAYYPSQLFPWSANLTGTQGEDPGYDPLAYMVEATHAAGLQFHAWVNPLRVQMNGVPDSFAQDSLLERWSAPEQEDWILPWAQTQGQYLNPAIPQVRQYIADGVQEIVANYDVDGIQFDDYFYPTEDGTFDKASYAAYCDSLESGETPLSQKAWRMEQVSQMVQLVYDTVHQTKEDVVFGISPQGNVENDNRIGADVERWGREQGYVDYLCPQLYYNFENPVLPYDKAARQWRSLVQRPEIALYFGLGLYKANSDADQGTWQNSNSILSEQVVLGRAVGCDGFCFYSCAYWDSEETQEEVANVMAVLN